MAPDEPTRESTPRPLAKRTIMKPVEHERLSNDEPPYQPRNLVKKKLAISVMRMKGYDIGGITVADTTRTILEETIDARLGRMTQEMQTLPDSPRQKQMRRKINLTLASRESLNEKLLDLQDANDLWTANFQTEAPRNFLISCMAFPLSLSGPGSVLMRSDGRPCIFGLCRNILKQVGGGLGRTTRRFYKPSRSLARHQAMDGSTCG